MHRNLNKEMYCYLWLFVIFPPLILAFGYTRPPNYTPIYRPHGTPAPTHRTPHRRHRNYKQLTPIYEARNIEYAFPTEQDRLEAIANGRYIPESAFPVDVDVYYPPGENEPKIYISIPRFGHGIPYSLARLTNVSAPQGNQVEAFPTYAMHSSYGANCDGLTSVFRTQIDQCGRMWIVDSGEINRIHLCYPQIVVLDLNTNNIVAVYRLPQDVYKRDISRIVNILVDITDPPPRGLCKQAFVYLADPTGFTIIVYDVANLRSWTVENKFTYPNPNFAMHTIAGESFELMDGAFGLAVTPQNLGLRRMLYFHSLTDDVLASVPLDVINNATNFRKGLNSSLDQFTELGHRGIQCGASAMTSHGWLLCGFFEPIALVGWDIRTPYSRHYRFVLAENPQTLQFIGGLKVITNPRGKQEVWMLSNRAQKFFSGATNYAEINYRIQKCGVNELSSGALCIN